MSSVELVYQRFSADNGCLLSRERTRRETAAIHSNRKSRGMLKCSWELRKVMTCIIIRFWYYKCPFSSRFSTQQHTAMHINSLTAAVFPVQTDQESVLGEGGDLRGVPPHPHNHTVQNPFLLLKKKKGRRCFSLRHRCPEWLQMTGLYSFHCEPIIAVMLISLFNYPAGSHGKAVIKRKSAKMNRVRVPRLNTVTSALWDNTWELDSIFYMAAHEPEL